MATGASGFYVSVRDLASDSEETSGDLPQEGGTKPREREMVGSFVVLIILTGSRNILGVRDAYFFLS